MKSSFIISALLLTSSMVLAQSVEFRISGGKGFAKGGMLISDYDEIYTSGSPTYGSGYSQARMNVKDHYFSVGQGTRFEGSIILYVQKNIGLFLQSGYSSGTQGARSSYTSVYQNPNGTSQSDRNTDQENLKFSYIPLVAGFQVNFSEGTLRPYGGAGIGLYLASSITDNFSSDYPSYGTIQPTTHFDRERKLSTNTPIGYVGYLGIDYALTESVKLFAEAKATLVSFYVTQSEITLAKMDGVDQLSTFTRSQKVTTYQEDYNFTRTDAASQNEPSSGGAPWPISGNSVGVTIGLSITL